MLVPEIMLTNNLAQDDKHICKNCIGWSGTVTSNKAKCTLSVSSRYDWNIIATYSCDKYIIKEKVQLSLDI